MKAYQHLLDKYSLGGWQMYTTHSSEWGDVPAADRFLARFWMSEDEFRTRWVNRVSQVFGEGALDAVNPMFRQSFIVRALRGGALLGEKEWNALQRCWLDTGDAYIAILEKPGSADEPPVHLKVPTSATWADLMSGNFISAMLFEMPYKEYLVVGESATWGVFEATEHDLPVSLVGNVADHDAIFGRELRVSAEEEETIYGWLPDAYKSVVKRCG
jgi:hypothetical protein